MILAITMATVLFFGSLVLHCSTIRRLGRIETGRTRTFFLICLGLGVLHVIEVGAYAAAFAIGREFGIGTFDGMQAISWMDTFYFSLVNFTTLGLGQIYPTGHLRFLAGFEAFNGFLCISMSASVLFRWLHEEPKVD